MSWVPTPVLESLGLVRVKKVRFQQASGAVIERWVGFAILHAAGAFEGMNLKVDLVGRQLVSAGPVSAAAAA